MSTFVLTHWGLVTHICVGKLNNIGSDNGLSPGRRQAIIWTNAGILLIGPLGTIFSEILIEILTFSFKKMHLKVLSAKWQPRCLGLNVLIWKCNGACHLAASAGATILVPYHKVKSLQLKWRSGTRRFHWSMVPNLQMSCSDLTYIQGPRTVIPVMTTRAADMPYWFPWSCHQVPGHS